MWKFSADDIQFWLNGQFCTYDTLCYVAVALHTSFPMESEMYSCTILYCTRLAICVLVTTRIIYLISLCLLQTQLSKSSSSSKLLFKIT